MTNKFATSKERILYFIECQGITKSTFYKKTGLKRGVLDTDKLGTAIYDTYLANILVTYPNLSAEWLILGKGKMLKTYEGSDQPESALGEPPGEHYGKKDDIKDEYIQSLKDQVTMLKDQVAMLKDQLGMQGHNRKTAG